jgi:hypothetical protein
MKLSLRRLVLSFLKYDFHTIVTPLSYRSEVRRFINAPID